MNTKSSLHHKNPHRQLYNFEKLVESSPALAPFVIKNKYGNESVDFSNPKAVKALNQAILKHFYKVDWNLPEGYLLPPVPSRADYIHHIADLLGELEGQVRVLDIGTGANCIYPIIGHRAYGWHFLGTDIDPAAIKSAATILEANNLADVIELKLQSSPSSIFKGILDGSEKFALSICNPPFHSSMEEAQQGTKRKWKNLRVPKKAALNFGGSHNELFCEGGEVGFLCRMIEESILFQKNIRWFSSLVSKKKSLQEIYEALELAKVKEVKTIDLSQGQKKSRIVAWTF
jgi:23S rRNA (adenine1618-N6)-methyltransferase